MKIGWAFNPPPFGDSGPGPLAQPGIDRALGDYLPAE